MALTPERIREIERMTLGQKANPTWRQYRHNRLTASNFGFALNGLRQFEYNGNTRIFYYLRRAMFNPRDNTCDATEWGDDHESEGIKEYERQTGKRVIASGMWLFPEGDLSATPDGLVLDPSNPSKYIGIVEIKCPFKCRNLTIRTGQEWSQLVSYLDTENKLKQSSDNYHQIQGALYATNLPWCDLVIWCPSAILVQRIELDEAWRAGSLSILHFIYHTHILRSEDQMMSDYQLRLKTGKTINIEGIIKSNPTVERKFYSALTKAIAIHIGRWMSFKCYPRGITAEYLSYFDEMKGNLCQLCVIRYLIYWWMLDRSNPSISHHIQQLMQGDWKIEDYMWQAARKQLSEMAYYLPLTLSPCFCRKF